MFRFIALPAAFLILLMIAGSSTAQDSFVQSEDIAPGASWSYTFTTTGTFDYHNHHAPAVQAKIMVHEAQGTGASHTVRYDTAWTPDMLMIASGDTVTFVNDSDAAIMVMGGTQAAGGNGHDDHDHGDHDHGTADGESNDSPAPALGLVVAGLAALAFVRRRA